MIAQETWRRFRAHWPKLMLAGLFVMLLYGAVAILASLLLAPVFLAAGVGMAGALLNPDPGALFALFGQVAGVFLLVALLSLAIAPLAMGGLLHTVIQVQREEPVGPADFWQAGMANYTKLLKLMLITAGVWILLGLVGALLMLIPVLGQLIWGIAALMVGLAVGSYAPYMALAYDLSASEAISRAFRILTARALDLLLTGLLLMGFSLLFGLVSGVLALIPVLGLLVLTVLNVALGPLLLLYLATRYQTNIASAFPPAGGGFHPSPPLGP